MILEDIMCGKCLINKLRSLDVYKHITNEEFRLRTKDVRMNYASTVIQRGKLYKCVGCEIYFYRGKRVYKHHEYEYIRSVALSDYYSSAVSARR